MRRRRREREEAESQYYHQRRYLREDVTVFGEQLSELHVDTLTDVLSEDARDYYRYTLESYERAKAALAAAVVLEDLEPVGHALVEGRHQRACVLALAHDEPLPAKLEECFFNPQHGPSAQRVWWTPTGGVQREVAVCAADARRLAAGEAPKVRLVRVGDRYVPMHEVDPERRTLLRFPVFDYRAIDEQSRDTALGDYLARPVPGFGDKKGDWGAPP